MSMRPRALFSSFPIVAALNKAEKFVAEVLLDEYNLSLKWNATNRGGLQEALLQSRIWEPTLDAISTLAADELSAIAHWDVEVINNFLRKEGFDIQLNPWGGDRLTFGIAGLIKLLRKWRVAGESGYTVCGWCKAFRLDAQERDVKFFKSGDRVVVCIPTTTSGDCVYITKAERPLSHFSLLFHCMAAQNTMRPCTSFTGAILPTWTFQEKVDVSELVGLWARDEAEQIWRLTQALMEGKSAFCKEGTSFKAAFAAAVTRGMSMPKSINPQDHIVDYNLAMWIGRNGVSVPLGAVYVETTEFSSTKVYLD